MDSIVKHMFHGNRFKCIAASRFVVLCQRCESFSVFLALTTGLKIKRFLVMQRKVSLGSGRGIYDPFGPCKDIKHSLGVEESPYTEPNNQTTINGKHICQYLVQNAM